MHRPVIHHCSAMESEREKVSNYDCDELCDYLLDKETQTDVIFKIREQQLAGLEFIALTSEEIRELFPVMGLRKRVSRCVQELGEGKRQAKSAQLPVRLSFL